MKFLISLLTAFLISFDANASDIDNIIMHLGLPVVVIETENGEEPTCEVIEPPEGCIGTGITNVTKVQGNVKVMSSVGDVIFFDSNRPEEVSGGMTIRNRGNSSSAYSVKKSFKIKLRKKGDMLGRSDKYADKDWALLKNDFNCLNTIVALKISELMGQVWVPAMKYVNVVMNGDYRGIYMLSETVKRNAKCRIDIDKNGYIIESDPYYWNENVKFNGAIDIGPDSAYYQYTFKFPKDDDITEEQLSYIKRAVGEFELSLKFGNYDKYIDLPSFANWILIHDILGTYDSAGSNRFITKADSTLGSPFCMGPTWDFDAIFGSDYSDKFARVHNEFYYRYLFNNTNNHFVKAYVERWNDVKDSVFATIQRFLEDFRRSEEAKAIDSSWVADDKRWHNASAMRYGQNVNDNIDYMQNWFFNRKKALDSLISKIDTAFIVSNVQRIRKGYVRNQDSNAYSLLGKKVDSNYKGIIIRRGRKTVKR